MSTNEPVKDRMIPNTETSVIAAIGPLNLRGEANAHQSFDKTTEDIRIDFTSRNVHECTNSLYNLPDMSDIKPWPVAVITNETMFSARIGPAGGKRGYTRITGNFPPNLIKLLRPGILIHHQFWQFFFPLSYYLFYFIYILFISLIDYNILIIKYIGQPAWGIAWYINDLLIPEITVERGQTYTFIVEGGNDPANPARQVGISS